MASIIDKTLGSVLKFADDAYNEGWLLYAIIGIAVVFVLVMIN